jgi:hypothetical protein
MLGTATTESPRGWGVRWWTAVCAFRLPCGLRWGCASGMANKKQTEQNMSLPCTRMTRKRVITKRLEGEEDEDDDEKGEGDEGFFVHICYPFLCTQHKSTQHKSTQHKSILEQKYTYATRFFVHSTTNNILYHLLKNISQLWHGAFAKLTHTPHAD